jgi:hypothetical protein
VLSALDFQGCIRDDCIRELFVRDVSTRASSSRLRRDILDLVESRFHDFFVELKVGTIRRA